MTAVTLVGNLAGDPELRYTPNGVAVANFTVCHTPRVKRGDEYEDGPTIFMRCAIWREYAEHAAASLHRGDRVIVSGRIKSTEWTADDGTKRSRVEMDADEVGPSLRFAECSIKRTERSSAPADSWAGAAATPLAAAG